MKDKLPIGLGAVTKDVFTNTMEGKYIRPRMAFKAGLDLVSMAVVFFSHV